MVTHHLTRANFSEGSKSITNEVNVFRSTSHIIKLRFFSGISKKHLEVTYPNTAVASFRALS